MTASFPWPGQDRLATAILDRLLHHATTLSIKGESYRLKEKRRAGLLGSRKPEPEDEKEGVAETQSPDARDNSADEKGTS